MFKGEQDTKSQISGKLPVRDIVKEYHEAARVKTIVFEPTRRQKNALRKGGGSIPYEIRGKLENGAPVDKEP